MMQLLLGKIKIQKLNLKFLMMVIQINRKMKIKKNLSILIIKDCLHRELRS